MIPIPAIDLKNGRVVRLFQGKFEAETVYSETAEAVAHRFEASGARRIHVVDLDGALKGEPKNKAQIERILKTVKVPVEVGGGIRDLKQVEDYFKMGVRWTILGTKAAMDPGFLEEALKEFDEKVIVGIDAREGRVAVDGWTKVLPIEAVDLAKSVEKAGARTVIYTDISKDGALQGPNLSQVERVCESVRLDVIASGGIGSAQDLKALKGLEKKNLIGVVIGKALYEKRLTVEEAVAACSQSG